MKIFAPGETVWPTAGPKAAQSDLRFAEFYRSALMSRFARSRKKIRDDNVHFSRIHDHLKHSRFPILPNLLYVQKISALLATLAFPCQRTKAYLHAKANAANL